MLGRDAGCEVSLSEGSISRRHARLIFRDGNWQLVDMESRNGLWFQDERVPSCVLHGGEELRLGKLRLRFHADAGGDLAARPAGAAARGGDEEGTHLIRSTPTDVAPPVKPSGLASERRAAHIAAMQQSGRPGWWGGDLAQRSALVRWSIYLLVLAVAIAACAGAFLLVQALRS